MTEKPTQQLLPFDVPVSPVPPAPRAESAPDRQSEDAQAVVERLRDWLRDPRTGRMTDFAEETLYAVSQVLVEGKNSWFHRAEDQMEALKLRNGRAEGDDIPRGITVASDENFQGDIEPVLDCLHERLTRSGEPSAKES